MPKREPYILGFDTEDDGKGTPLLFSAVHEGGTFYTRDRHDFLERLRVLSMKVRGNGKYVQAWATNLEYDLVNVFGMDRIAEVRFAFGRSVLIRATWKGIHFRDTLRHIPASVAELGKLVGLPKLPKRFTSVRYCVRDAAITYRAARYLYKTYGDLGITPRGTLASSALALWRGRYFAGPLQAPTGEIIEAARAAYHGGRTECFGIGEFRSVTVIDAASMYPWAMVCEPLPVPWGPFRLVREGEVPEAHGLYRCRIDSRLDPGVLPLRTDEGTVYPIGTWTAWITGEEAVYVQTLGVKIRVLSGYRFLESCEPFTGYIAELFDRKNRSRGPERLLYKLLLNALYGKFGERGHRVVIETLAQYEARRYQPQARIWNGFAVYRVDGGTRPWANVVWSAFVTARARVRLHKELQRVIESGGLPLYCDTDSIIATGSKLVYAAKAERPGQFEKRGSFPSVLIRGKKEYALYLRKNVCIPHVKGVPASVRREYLASGRAIYRKPTRLMEATVRGTQPNVWGVVMKQRRVGFVQRRSRKADGTLLPVLVRDGRIISAGGIKP